MYDPVRIRSHPGVRSDLFQRPVSSALVTDFFGGVADVDVVESHLFDDLHSTQDVRDPVSPPSPQPDSMRSDVNASRSMEWTDSRRRMRRGSGPVHERRAWVGLSMVAVLVGLVLLQSRFRITSGSKDK